MRWTSAASAEAGGAAEAEGRGENVILIPQDHHPQQCRLSGQAGKQARRQCLFHPSLSFECSWDLQLVESSCVRRLRREALHLILGERGPAYNQGCRSPSGEGKGGPPFGPAPTAVMEGWNTHSWLFTPHAESAIYYEGPAAEKKLNLCYMFGMADDDELVEKALMALSWAAITS